MPPVGATSANGKGELKGVGSEWECPLADEWLVNADGLPDIELVNDAKTEGAGDAIAGLPIVAVGGFILFSFCLLQFKKEKI